MDQLRRNNDNKDKLFIDNSNWIVNISSLHIPNEIIDFLSLGPKFALQVDKSDFRIDHYLAYVEDVLSNIPEGHRELLRARITNIVTNHVNLIKNQGSTAFKKMYQHTKTFLKQHPEIYVLQADKGGCTVIMNKEDYIKKTEDLLNDETTYKKLNKDPTTGVQNSFNELIKLIKQRGEISDESTKRLIIYNSTFPKLYCLPKVHKPLVPLRPIVSSVNSTTYEISRFLADILKQAFEGTTDYNIPDSFTFVNRINGLVLPERYVLISLDVVSLFTNIPLHLIRDIISDKWDMIDTCTSLSKPNFLKLVDFIFNNSYFSFNNKFYKQVFGTPMGSPISPILATLILDHVLDVVSSNLPFVFPFIFKYVDDIICAVPNDKVTLTLDRFNSYNQHIQFTVESEFNQSVPFLDTRVIRDNNNTIMLDWYQKPTASNRYINYFSNHPKKQKINTVIAMRNRITHISDAIFLKDNLKKLFNIFMNNGYPKHLLKKLIYNTNTFDGQFDDGNNSQINYKKLPYINNLTDKVITLFKSYTDVNIAKFNTVVAGNLHSKLKDRTPLLFNSGVIYKIPCSQCEACYIGQTSQWLRQRLNLHKSDCHLLRNRCALADHFLETGHSFDFQNTKLLECNNNYKIRTFLEMCYINKNLKCINYSADTNKLSNIYINLIQTNLGN